MFYCLKNAAFFPFSMQQKVRLKAISGHFDRKKDNMTIPIFQWKVNATGH
ncbi:hypothetical protein FHS56_000632 [Thermonema lapsum]|uniref:Uncharacterized protein n=1 Tax=Thermonema lapsum TaxID=28195 RepID=A0A846MNM4_9BACT|nr:hypothetical protein [Thermonema lapsum]